MSGIISKKYYDGELDAAPWFSGIVREFVETEMNSAGRHYHTMKHVRDLVSHFVVDVQYDICDAMKIDGPLIAELTPLVRELFPHAVTHDLTYSHLSTNEQVRVFEALADIVLPAVAFHDIVYDPTKNDNEEASARIAFMYLPSELPIEAIQNCILATKTHEANTVAEKIMCDIDMQILSSMWPNYLKYARQIRQEYIHVPFDAYVEGRKGFLEKLDGQPIYHLKLRLCDEEKAQANITREIELLKTKPREFLLV